MGRNVLILVIQTELDHFSVRRMPDRHAIGIGPLPRKLHRMGQRTEAQAVWMRYDADEVVTIVGGDENVPVSRTIGHGLGRA